MVNKERCYFFIVFIVILTNSVLADEKEQLLRKLNRRLPEIFSGENPEGDEIEIIYLPSIAEKVKTRISLEDEINYDFKAFGSNINLRLRPNTHLIAPNFRTVIRKDYDEDEQLDKPADNKLCHYLHDGDGVAAAFSFCDPNLTQGLLFLPNETFEIQPVPQRFSEDLLGNDAAIPHLIKRAPRIPHNFHDDELVLPFSNLRSKRSSRNYSKKQNRNNQGNMQFVNRPTIELALFFDEPAYRIFSPFFEYNDDKLRDMLLAYINGVQALYHHPSLGKPIDLVLVRLELFRKQPNDLPHYEGERNQLLDSFCKYNEGHNPKEDSNPEHWDMGLYVSGLDFFAYEKGQKSGVTMGLATVGGVCMEQYNCIIAELGTTNVFGKPYPSAGFTSVYILAHEIGHNIGMHHDGTSNNCPREGFIMSPSRGTNGETLWSSCSANIANSMTWAHCLEDGPKTTKPGMNHNKFNEVPGQTLDAKQQCAILLKDHDAEINTIDSLEDVCENLQCRTPHRSGFYFAGPALEGTNCGKNKWCQGGSCVAQRNIPTPDKVIKGGWTPWKKEKCKSGCLKNARGYQSRSRTCTNPAPVNTNEGCDGPSFAVDTCRDDYICKKKRINVHQFASKRCTEFSKLIPNLDPKGSGLQAPHESTRLWMGCAIFCKSKDMESYYTPRLDLNDFGVDAYFPDGTWCNHDGNLNYFCLQHHCLPENFKFTKKAIDTEDVPLPQNARTRMSPLTDDIFKYLSVDANGKPLLKTLLPSVRTSFSDDSLLDDDYLELPTSTTIF